MLWRFHSYDQGQCRHCVDCDMSDSCCLCNHMGDASSTVFVSNATRRFRGGACLEPGVPRQGWQFFASQADCVSRRASHSASVGEVSVRPACSHPLHLLRHFLADPFRTCFGCCSSAASAPPPPSVHSTLLVTTSLRAQFDGCWADEVSRRRARRLGCAERRGAVLNVWVGDLDLPPRGAVDQRPLEVVPDGLPGI